MKKKNSVKKSEEKILSQVPPDYYQRGIKDNFFQRIWHKGKLEAVSDLIEGEPESILDVGCASGWFLFELSKKYPNAKCTGIDKYKKAIEYGQKKYKKIKLIFGDAHEIPFKNSSFNLVICTEVLEHVENPKAVLQEIKRVLTPNGSVIFEIDTGNLLFRLVWFWWTNIRRGVWRDAHLHVYNLDSLIKLIKKNGFKIKKQKIFNFTMGVAFLLKKELGKI